MDIQRLEILDIAAINRDLADTLLANVKRVEKKSFPAVETFDFDTELRKHNTHLICAVAVNGKKEHTPLVAYLVYARTRRTALLHKICILQSHRRKGVGKQMMTWLLNDLKRNGCDSVQLWVDESREPARALYDSLGFEQVDYVVDYYSPGRAGLKMTLHLQFD
ncbi:hypothetical protein MMC16_000761 [Acarospora aff. strigata]|nr:hypothetical protein [Acarospora aff. strigata]